MNRRRSLALGIGAGVGMLILILDGQTAVSAAVDGIELCIKTVVPSLFPFFIFSIILTGALSGTVFPFLRPIGKLCGIPKGAESILLAGLLGGYPVGAQCISQAYAAGQLSRSDARRMLGFCNNAGPAFVFGIVGTLFSSPLPVFILWGIQIASSLIVGMLLPGKRNEIAHTPPKTVPVTVSQALERSVKTMASVCGWVVLFRVILAFAERWFLWLLPSRGQLLFAGLLELSNGCYGLHSLNSEAERFLFVGLFLSFGGICVGMQTVSVTGQARLDTGLYFPGKLLQSGVCVLISLCIVPFLFPNQPQIHKSLLLLPILYTIILVIILNMRKNKSSIPEKAGV